MNAEEQTIYQSNDKRDSLKITRTLVPETPVLLSEFEISFSSNIFRELAKAMNKMFIRSLAVKLNNSKECLEYDGDYLIYSNNDCKKTYVKIEKYRLLDILNPNVDGEVKKNTYRVENEKITEAGCKIECEYEKENLKITHSLRSNLLSEIKVYFPCDDFMNFAEQIKEDKGASFRKDGESFEYDGKYLIYANCRLTARVKITKEELLNCYKDLISKRIGKDIKQYIEEIFPNDLKRLEAIRKLLEMEQELTIAKQNYEFFSNCEELYDKKIEPTLSMFDKIGGILCVFAGCVDEKAFDMLSTTMKNKIYDLKVLFSDDRIKQNNFEYRFPELDKLENVGVYQDDEIDKLIDRLKKASGLEFNKIRKNYEQWQRLKRLDADVKKSAKYQKYSRKKTEDIEKDAYNRKKNIQKYVQSTNLIKVYIMENRKSWDYIKFLKGSVPFVKELINPQTENWSENEYIDFSRRIRKMPENLNDELEFIEFRWIFPYDEFPCEKMRFDFIAAGASWPGLYFVWKNKSDGIPSCILPGGIFTE